MSDYSFEEDITTAEKFETALGQLLAATAHNGIDPEGSWVYRNGGNPVPDWEVIVYQLEGTGGSDE